MPRHAIVAALEREISGLIRNVKKIEREYEGRKFVFFEQDEMVAVCGGIGAGPARRAAEAVIALYHPTLLQSVGFAGALQADLRVGDVVAPAVVVDARDGSRTQIEGGSGVLLTFGEVAGRQQKNNLSQAYAAQAVDMEAAAVAAAARVHGVRFSAVKVISDELHFEMPETARFIDAQGHFKTAGFALFIAMRPWLWMRAAQLATNSSRAAKVLVEHLKGSCQALSNVAEAKTT